MSRAGAKVSIRGTELTGTIAEPQYASMELWRTTAGLNTRVVPVLVDGTGELRLFVSSVVEVHDQ